MTRWGIHWRNVNPLAPDTWEIAEHFDSFVVMSNMGPELPRRIREKYPDALIIDRLYLPPGNLPTPEAFVEMVSDHMESTRDVVDLYIILNEVLKEYGVSPGTFTMWFLAVLSLLRAKFPGCQFGFPMPEVTGEDAWQWAVACSEAIQAADFIAEHCYWEQDWQMDDWNWGARYYRCHQQWPDKAIHITEFGSSAEIDGLTKAAQYSHYLREMPEYVGSANAFLMDGTKDWKTYSVTEQMAYVMTFGQPVGQPVPGKPAESSPGASTNEDEGVVMPYQVGQGILDAMTERGETPVEDENYLWPGLYSICASDKAVYIYSFKANKIARIPFLA